MATDAWPSDPNAQRSRPPHDRAVNAPDFQREVYCVLGLPFDAVTMTQAVAQVRQAAFTNKRFFISTPNLNFLIAARSDQAFRNSVLNSDLSLADGMPLIWMARLLGLPLAERVSGAGLFESLLAHAGPPVSVFFFGGPDGVAATACEKVNARAGGLRCVGFESPGFGSLESISDAQRIARINASGAQFVIVALGAKKGQAWIERNAAALTAPVLCHLGAVVNFAAGVVQRAPRWVQVAGLEWAWRIKEEPALLRRYVDDGLAFLRLLWTRVLPEAATRALGHVGDSALDKPALASTTSATQVTIALAGAWGRSALPPLRAALQDAVASGLPICMDVERVTHVDNALIALLLLAFTPPAARTPLRVRGASPALKRTFLRHGAEFLLAESPASAQRHV